LVVVVTITWINFATFVKKNYEKNELQMAVDAMRTAIKTEIQNRKLKVYLFVLFFANILLTISIIFCIFAVLLT
jgi:hypothetical protein